MAELGTLFKYGTG